MAKRSTQITPPEHDPAVRVTAATLVQQRHFANQFNLTGLKKATSAISGLHDSRFRGRGMDYQESRVYQAGDDIRNMDWRVTARTGTAHTKLFQEERERPTHLVIDTNRCMRFGTRQQFKSVLAAKLAALLGWSSMQQGDRVGVMSFGAHGIHVGKPLAGKRGMMQMIAHLVEADQHDDGEDHDLDEALKQLRSVNRPGSLIILISDFYHLGEDARRHLLQLRKHNDVLALMISDPFENQTPAPARYGVRAAGHSQVLDTRRGQTRQRLSAFRRDHLDAVQAAVLRAGVPVIPLQTDDAWITTLKSSLKNPGTAWLQWQERVRA